MGELLRQRGGVWLEGGYLSWPFGEIVVHEDRIEVMHRRFAKSSRLRLRRRCGLLSTGLEIADAERPDRAIVFWSFSFSRLAACLHSAGYRVE